MDSSPLHRHPPEFWQMHIKHWLASGLMQKDYCHQQQLAVSTFRQWKRYFLKQIQAGTTAASVFFDYSEQPLPPDIPVQGPLWLFTRATSMNKSYAGLTAQVRQAFNHLPSPGHHYIFINRRKTQIKILSVKDIGSSLWGQQLEQGQYNTGSWDDEVVRIEWTQLQGILSGLDIPSLRCFRRIRALSPC